MKRILVPIDFSDATPRVIDLARQLARALDAEIHLVALFDAKISRFRRIHVDVDGGANNALIARRSTQIDHRLRGALWTLTILRNHHRCEALNTYARMCEATT